MSTSITIPAGYKYRATPFLVASVLLGSLAITACGCGVASNGMNAEGTRYFQQGHHAAAIRRFEEAIATNPRDADSYYNLAATYHQLAKSGTSENYASQAENYYNQCLDIEPNHIECYRGLAVLLAEQNRREQAVRLLKGWKDRNPFSPEPQVELARLYQEFGDARAAEEQLLGALAIDNSNHRARAALGQIRENQGDLQQALANYQVALSRNRAQPELATRVASLQAAVNPQPVIAPPQLITPPSITPPIIASPPQVITGPGNNVRY